MTAATGAAGCTRIAIRALLSRAALGYADLFDVLVRLSLQSGELRLLWQWSTSIDSDGSTLRGAYLAALDDYRVELRLLARVCRRQGLDIRLRPLFQNLELKEEFVSAWRHWQVVDLDALTLKGIHQALRQHRRVCYRGWDIKSGATLEDTDEYGQPVCWSRTVGRSPTGEHVRFQGGNSKQTVREIFRALSDKDAPDDTAFGNDPPHPAEYCW